MPENVSTIFSFFSFFAEYDWHLDNREPRAGNEINPDVPGYIFEKYIGQKQMGGVLHTEEDITGYISRNTIIPFLLDAARKDCAVGSTSRRHLAVAAR